MRNEILIKIIIYNLITIFSTVQGIIIVPCTVKKSNNNIIIILKITMINDQSLYTINSIKWLIMLGHRLNVLYI